MNSKRCSKCKQIKETNAFTKANTKPGGLRSRCKVCVKEFTKKGYQTLEMTHRTRHRYMRDWSDFFEAEYGEGPMCQLCDAPLSYHRDDNHPTVAFDHKNGNIEPIQGCPSAFCRTHPCTEEHKTTWRACDFGILCRHCNAALPTFNRERWLNRAMAYMSEVFIK